MTNQQILEQALLKAHHNGWKPLNSIDWRNVEITHWEGNGMVGIALIYGDKGSDVHWVRELEGIIFNHDFAKALWGTGFEKHPSHRLFDWEYHLQQMVIADYPIKYLGENI